MYQQKVLTSALSKSVTVKHHFTVILDKSDNKGKSTDKFEYLTASQLVTFLDNFLKSDTADKHYQVYFS